MVRRIVVVPHNPAWAAAFAAEARFWRGILGPQVVAIEHIGSTAIPGMPAKPIIDMLITVHDIDDVGAHDAALVAAGYWPRGENGIPGRRFYVKGTDEARTHHVHVFGVDSPEVERHLAFRDFMIAHPAEAQAYARLKEDLAARFPEDAEGYVAGKDAFVQEREARASAWRRDRES